MYVQAVSVKRSHTYLYTFLIVFLIFRPCSDYACTVFYMYKNGKVLGGSNEDWKDPNTRFWFYPASEGKHAWVKFGFSGGFPQAGMNDSGIFWDGTSNPWQGMPYSEENKQFYEGALMQKVMEESSSISEVTGIFDLYYCQDQYRGQYLVGGANGLSVIIDGDYYHHNDKSYQVLTNFHQSNPALGGHPCSRYNTATDMLENCDTLTEYYAGGVLSSTCQNGSFPTQYSLLFDPQLRQIYLFYYQNYEEYLLIKFDEFLSGDSASFNIPPLFSRVNLISPAHEEIVYSDSITLTWSGLPGSTYHVVLSDEKGNVKLERSIKFASDKHVGHYPLYFSLLLFPFILIFRRKLVKTFFLLLICMILLLSCKKQDEELVEDPRLVFTEVVKELEPATEYHWKLLMEPSSGVSLQTESVTYSFTTSDWM